ncbi:GATA transcription factor 9 [Tanacetum coccineum]|uniref:GATA transcription factor 9 n=1 Tax=Tanacetum coccineum TaxID=301880 RepID=A0ABQ5E815_9ASTR
MLVVESSNATLPRFQSPSPAAGVMGCALSVGDPAFALAVKTPDMAMGPMWPEDFVNACGVGNKSGSLVAEYRPAKQSKFFMWRAFKSHRKDHGNERMKCRGGLVVDTHNALLRRITLSTKCKSMLGA